MTDTNAVCEGIACSQLTPRQVFEALDSAEQGLSATEATQRLER